MRNKKGLPARAGFTVIEIIVTSTLLLVLAAAILGLQYMFSKSSVTAITSYNNVNDASSIFTTFTNDIRKSDNSENGGFLFESMQDNEIIFFSDVDYDGQTERVRYTKTLEKIERGVTEPSGNPVIYDTLTEKVKVLSDVLQINGIPAFFYYSSTWPQDTVNNPLPDGSRLAGTKLIRIVLAINDYNLDSFVYPRNLR